MIMINKNDKIFIDPHYLAMHDPLLMQPQKPVPPSMDHMDEQDG